MCRNQGRGAEKRVTGTNPGCPLVSESFPPEETWPDPSELRSTCLWSRGIRTWALKLNSLQAEPLPATRQASTGPGSLLALPFLSCSPLGRLPDLSVPQCAHVQTNSWLQATRLQVSRGTGKNDSAYCPGWPRKLAEIPK